MTEYFLTKFNFHAFKYNGLLGYLRGGVVVQAYNFEKYNFELDLKGKASTRPDIFQVVLGTCTQCCPRAKIGQKTTFKNQ